MADVPVKLGGKTQVWVNANPNHLLLERQHLYILDGANAGKFAIGDGVTLLGALTFYGGSSSGLTIGTTTITSGTNTRILYNNNGVLGEYAVTGTGTTAVLSTSPTFITQITCPKIVSASIVLSTGATTLTATDYTLTSSSTMTIKAAAGSAGDISFIAGTNGGGLYFNTEGTNKFIVNKSDSSVGNSTIPFVFTNVSETNKLTTANVANLKVIGGSKTWAAGTVALQYFNWYTSNTVAASSASTFTLVGSNVFEYTQGGTNATITTSAAIYVPTLALTNTTTGIGINIEAPSGATNNYAAKFTHGSGTTYIGTQAGAYSGIWFGVTPSSTNWSFAGNGAQTYIQGSTNVLFYVNATTQLNISSLFFHYTEAVNMGFGTTTGTKLGTATTQKIGFWNATPIVQPTTAVAASTLTSNGGTTLTSTDTIDGYTLLQVVKALRNTGLLA